MSSRAQAPGRWFDAAITRTWPLIGPYITLLVERALASHSLVNGPDPMLFRSMVYGDPARLSIHPSAVVNNALFNLSSGTVTVGPYAFFGHGVTILTGTHDLTKLGAERQSAVPSEGRDVVIGEGVWLSTNVTVVGPCKIGDHAAVGAGSLVLDDVEAYSVVAGSPACLKKMIHGEPRAEVRVVALSPFLPYPGACHAGADLLLAHLEAIGAIHDIALFGVAGPDAEAAAGLVPANLHLSGLLPYPPPCTHPVIARLTLHVLYLLGWDLLPTTGSDLVEMLSPATEHLREADIVELHWAGWLAPLIPVIKRLAPGAALVVIPVDVPWEAAERRFGLRGTRRRNGRVAHGARWLSFSAFRSLEAHLLGRADAALVLTERDRRLLIDAGMRCPILIRDPPLIAPEPAAPLVRAARSPGRVVLFTGALGRPENHSGVLWFLDEVWPSVEASCPGASFVVAGADPPDALLARASATVSVTGTVPSLTPFYETADVFVAPLLVGAGLKFKLPQAMLYGLPVVATPIAAEGIIEEGGPSIFAAVTGDPDAMARCVVNLLVRPEVALSQGERGRQWAAGHYDFDASSGRAIRLYEKMAQERTAAGSGQAPLGGS